MKPEEIRSRGAALAERVRTQVDTSQRLELVLRIHRRARIVAVAAAAAAVLVVVAGVLLLVRADEPPVITAPSTTIPSTLPGAQSLPVEVFMVLIGDYTVDEDTGACEGSGPLAGIGAGSMVHIVDESASPPPETAPTTNLPAGVEVTQEDARASFLLGSGDPAACVFTLPDLGYDISEYENIRLLPETDPDTASGMSLSGQRVIFKFENLTDGTP